VEVGSVILAVCATWTEEGEVAVTSHSDCAVPYKTLPLSKGCRAYRKRPVAAVIKTERKKG